jgi:predicted nuclease with TOPRIM domain
MAEPDNLILVHLRELRSELAEFREEVRTEFKRVDTRLDAMHGNGMKALKSFIGHRTMTERSMASFDDEVQRLRKRVDADIADLKQRVEQLEAGA